MFQHFDITQLEMDDREKTEICLVHLNVLDVYNDIDITQQDEQSRLDLL